MKMDGTISPTKAKNQFNSSVSIVMIREDPYFNNSTLSNPIWRPDGCPNYLLVPFLSPIKTI